MIHQKAMIADVAAPSMKNRRLAVILTDVRRWEVYLHPTRGSVFQTEITDEDEVDYWCSGGNGNGSTRIWSDWNLCRQNPSSYEI